MFVDQDYWWPAENKRNKYFSKGQDMLNQPFAAPKPTWSAFIESNLKRNGSCARAECGITTFWLQILATCRKQC